MSLWNEIDLSISADTLGGKGKGIQTLMRAGLRVPMTVAIGPQFFDEIENEFSLKSKRQSLVKAFSNFSSSSEDLRRTCLQYQGEFFKEKLPAKHENILKDIFIYYKDKFGSFCVRSSANREDGTESAFAGVFESYLNITEVEHFILAIKQSLAQVMSYEVIVNCLKNNIDPNSLKMGVIIQEFAPCIDYGVLFSTDPIGKDPDHFFLSIAKDGEKLMSGEIESKNYQCSRHHIEELPKKYQKLASKVEELEKLQGGPVDIEWGIDQKGDLIFFQCRSVTTYQSELASNVRWSRDLAEERYPEPMSPLGWSILRDVFETNLVTLKDRFGLKASSPDDVAITIGHYVYANDQFFALSNMKPHIWSLLPNILKIIAGLGLTIFMVPYIFILSLTGRTQLKVKDFLILGIYKFFIFVHAQDILDQWDKNLYRLIDEFDELSNEEISKYSITELYNYKYRLMHVGDQYMEPDLAIYVVKMACEYMVKRIGSLVMPNMTPIDFLSTVSQGLESNRTLEMAKSMDELSAAIKKQPELIAYMKNNDPDAFFANADSYVLKAFEKFEKLNGHLTVNWDFRVPTWQENKVHLFKMLLSIVENTERKDVADQASKKNESFKQKNKEILASMKQGFLQDFHEELLKYLREFMRIDEEHHFYCSRVFKSLRKLYMTLGQRLVEKGVLEYPEDIFMLKSQEVDELCHKEEFFSRRFLVSNRKKTFDAAFDINPPDEYLGSIAQYKETVRDGNSFRGTAASPGIVSGHVRIIKNLDDCHKIKKGDIIVTQTPNPVYVPLYSVAGAIVANTGSILSHGMVAAREYEIPAVIGIANISKILEEGQKVQVDGNTGTVTIST